MVKGNIHQREIVLESLCTHTTGLKCYLIKWFYNHLKKIINSGHLVLVHQLKKGAVCKEYTH